MNLSKEKSLISAFVCQSDTVRHSKASQLLFYGMPSAGTYVENAYVQALKKAVRICFSDVKYRGHFNDIYDTFVSLFYAYLLTKTERLLNIETTLAGWLFVTAKNFANNNRKEIDTLVGLANSSDALEYDSTMDALISKENEDACGSADVIIDDSESGMMWAEHLVNRYIDRISNEKYRTAIRAIVIEGMPREEFAEEQHISYQAVNLLVNHAMIALTNVALPDIRWRSKKCYSQYIDLVKDKNDVILLKEYFENNISKPGLALAVRRLIKISIREMKEQAAEERRESRLAVN